MMSLRRGFPVLLDLALIQVGILISYLARFGNELFLHRRAWGALFQYLGHLQSPPALPALLLQSLQRCRYEL